MIDIAKYSIIVLAVLVFIGGIIGFVKGKSKISVIAGTISAILLGGAYMIAHNSPLEGIRDSLGISGALILMFGMRLTKTKKFMPSGMMLILCLIQGGIALAALVTEH